MPIIGPAPSTSTALADVDDLAILLQRTLTEDEADAAALVLDIASETIRTFTHQTLSRVDDDELVLPANWTFEMWLPERPVISIASISLDGSAVSASSYSWAQNGRIEFPAGIGWLGEHGYYVGGSRQATIVYSHGFDPMRADIKGICLEMARAAVVLPDGAAASQEQIGNYSVSFRPEAAAVLTESQQKRLRPYRPPVTSAPIVAGALS